jgi:plastocyanin
VLKRFEPGIALVGALAMAGSALAQAPGQLVVALRLDRGKAGMAPADGAVVWFPDVADTRAPSDPPVMKQREKQFVPHLVVVRKGAVVEFPNEDRVYHNVFSRSPGASFDLGLFRDGATRSVRFDRLGLVRVFCNIHAQMASNVMVLGDVLFATTDATGSARLEGLPPGRHPVKIWHEMAGERDAEVVIPAGGAGRLELDLKTLTLPPAHKNKFGQDYPKSAKDVDRY